MSWQSRPSSSWRPARGQREVEVTDDDGGGDVEGDDVRGRRRDHSPGFRSEFACCRKCDRSWTKSSCYLVDALSVDNIIVIQRKLVTVTASGTAKKCYCKRMAGTVSL